MLRKALCLAVVFLLGLAVGVWTNEKAVARSLGVATLSAQGQRSVGDADRTDADDNSFVGIINRLGSVANIVMAASSRLAAINAVTTDPPDDGKPALQVAIDTIRVECQTIEAILADLESRIR